MPDVHQITAKGQTTSGSERQPDDFTGLVSASTIQIDRDRDAELLGQTRIGEIALKMAVVDVGVSLKPVPVFAGSFK